MNAIMVCVNYSDRLRLTLPYNRHHFDDMLVVTDLHDYDEVHSICQPLRVDVFATDSFYANGAAFNKWRAMEEGLTTIDHGGEKWLCILDADVVWPKETKLRLGSHRDCPGTEDCWCGGGGYPAVLPGCFTVYPGQLCTPLRRMYPTIPTSIPEESTWKQYPIHRNTGEWVGYSQIFHCTDDALSKCARCGCHRTDHYDYHNEKSYCHGNCNGCDGFVWHEVNWRHAGGADSFFQQRWDPKNKIRPPFEVLHLGEAGTNWCGRTERMVDGSLPRDHDKHRQELQRLMISRRTQPRGNYNNPVEKIL